MQQHKPADTPSNVPLAVRQHKTSMLMRCKHMHEGEQHLKMQATRQYRMQHTVAYHYWCEATMDVMPMMQKDQSSAHTGRKGAKLSNGHTGKCCIITMPGRTMACSGMS